VHDLRTVYDKINFVKLAKPLLTFSIITIIVGAIIVSIFRLNLGIDFTSGTRVDLQSDQAIKTEQVSKQFKDMGLDPSQVTTS
ncbi:protein translocase subunit SecDF, partial [Mammaliicoccus sciuri]|nr:protein translocase subunit SecDF [Mammaliicoccus sciuri]